MGAGPYAGLDRTSSMGKVNWCSNGVSESMTDLLLPSGSLCPVGERGLGDASGIAVEDESLSVAASRAALWSLVNSSMVRLFSGELWPYPRSTDGGTVGGWI